MHLEIIYLDCIQLEKGLPQDTTHKKVLFPLYANDAHLYNRKYFNIVLFDGDTFIFASNSNLDVAKNKTR